MATLVYHQRASAQNSFLHPAQSFTDMAMFWDFPDLAPPRPEKTLPPKMWWSWDARILSVLELAGREEAVS
jgi:hypothetical protein